MERDEFGRFIPGTNGNTFEGFGIWYDIKGYPCIWVDGKTVKIHVFVWEREYGSKPEGYQLHHIDFDKSNYSLNNLELVTQSDHLKIHAGWIRNDKGVWILKPCKDCKKLLPLDKFYKRKGLTPSNRCKKCSSIFWKNERQNNKEYREKKKTYLKEYYQKNKEKYVKRKNK